jgi:hypothetical protein
MDLRLLQKLQFSGYASFTSDWMRITDVDYTVAATGDGIEKSVKVQFTSDAKFSNIRRMYRCATPDPVGEVGCIFDAKVGQMPGNEMGTVVAVDESTNTATVELDDGRTVEARNV